MDKKEVKILRDKINDLDNKLLDLLDQRSHIVEQIGKFKDKSKGIIDQERESSVLSRLISLTKGKYSKDTIIRILSII